MKQINLNSLFLGLVLTVLGVLLMFATVAGFSFSVTSLLLFLFFVLLTLILYRIYLFTKITYFKIMVGTSLSVSIITFMGIFIHYYYLWPLFLLSPAIGMIMTYKGETLWDNTILIPTIVLCGLTITFYICILFGWQMLKYVWPTFILWPAIGIYILSTILDNTVMKKISHIFFGIFILLELLAIGMFFKVLWGIVLIGLGSYFIYRAKWKK